MKLMIVDDHAETRRLIREMIGGLAVAVCECASGEEALFRCVEFRPDFVTVDLNMKMMNGFVTTRAILARCPTAEVVMVAQPDVNGAESAALRAGASHFFSKDDLNTLRTYCENRLGNHSDNNH